MYELKIKEYRIAAGYTQDYVSNILGVSKSYYCELENGKYPVKLSTLCKIGQVLNISANSLFIHKLQPKQYA